jgi:hypothetical protein
MREKTLGFEVLGQVSRHPRCGAYLLEYLETRVPILLLFHVRIF